MIAGQPNGSLEPTGRPAVQTRVVAPQTQGSHGAGDNVTYSILFEGRVIGHVELTTHPAIQKRIGSQKVLAGSLRPTEHYHSARKHATTFADFLASIVRTGTIEAQDQAAVEAAFSEQRFTAVDSSGLPLNAAIQVQEFSNGAIFGDDASPADDNAIMVIAVLLES